MNWTQSALKIFAALILVVGIAACAGGDTEESTGQYIDSTAVSTKVRTAIIQDPEVSVFNVDVETYKGVVQLSGFVDSEADKTRAGEIASEVEGVESVVNNIVVKTQLK